MLSENTVEKILEHGLQQGADFSEVFVEDTVSSSISLLDHKIDEINSSNSFGIGIRLLYGNEAYYGYATDTEQSKLLKLTAYLATSWMNTPCERGAVALQISLGDIFIVLPHHGIHCYF
jgi:Predicted Zn-dependent proteases and their inactivated homologs